MDEKLRLEVARIVTQEWWHVAPCRDVLPDKVTFVEYVRPGAGREKAPFWQVWIKGVAWGVRPDVALDTAILMVATALYP